MENLILDHEDRSKIDQFIDLSCGIISVIASITVILIIILHKSMRAFSFQLLSLVCFSNIIYSMSNLISHTPSFMSYNTPCLIQGILRYFGSISTVLWVATMCFVSYRQLVSFNKDLKKQIWRLAAINYTLSAIFSVIPMIHSISVNYYYEKIDGIPYNCAMEEKDQFNLYFYVPITLLIIITTIISAKIIKKLRQIGKLKTMKKILIFPLLLLITWVPAIVHHASQTLGSSKVNYGITLIYLLLSRSQGLLFAIFYGGSKLIQNIKRNRKAAKAQRTKNRLVSSGSGSDSSRSTFDQSTFSIDINSFSYEPGSSLNQSLL